MTMDQSGAGQAAPPVSQPPAAPPPPTGWQSTPTPPGAPPPAGGQPGGMPSWTNNITARGTIAGPGGVAVADTPDRVIAAVIDFIILGVIGFIVGAIIHPILGEKFGAGTLFQFTVPSLVSSIAVALIMLAVAGAYFIGMWT
ncbi:MAG TPA: RDD family protein, partial [Candidatus Limnocylindrales bacterium]|nr:RDD family protein [Candidatus Limnocylindrales bacterium]